MSLSKDLYERGYIGKIERKHPLLEIGTRFTINSSHIKIAKGNWEVITNKNAPLYVCKRVLANGTLSKSGTLENLRNFHESVIYSSFE